MTDTLDLLHQLTRTHKTTIENDDGTYKNRENMRQNAPNMIGLGENKVPRECDNIPGL